MKATSNPNSIVWNNLWIFYLYYIISFRTMRRNLILWFIRDFIVFERSFHTKFLLWYLNNHECREIVYCASIGIKWKRKRCIFVLHIVDETHIKKILSIHNQKEKIKKLLTWDKILLFFMAPRRQIMENDNNNKKCIR